MANAFPNNYWSVIWFLSDSQMNKEVKTVHRPLASMQGVPVNAVIDNGNTPRVWKHF